MNELLVRTSILTVLTVVSILALLASLYVGGYVLLPDKMGLYSNEWQFKLYQPAIRAQVWFTDKPVTAGYIMPNGQRRQLRWDSNSFSSGQSRLVRGPALSPCAVVSGDSRQVESPLAAPLSPAGGERLPTRLQIRSDSN